MLVIVPASTEVTETNVAASAKAEWSSATTYTIGQTVKYTTGQSVPHHEFESKTNDNLNHQPAIGGDDHWLDLGATNQHKMFDNRNSTATVASHSSGLIQVTLRPPSRVGVVSLLGMKGVKSVTVEQQYGANIVSSETIELLTTDTPVGMWTYFFGDYRVTTSAVVTIPGFWYRPYVTITLTPEVEGVPAQCGVCFFGQSFYIGDTDYGAAPGLIDYSTFEKDVFGETTLVSRLSVRDNNYTVWTDTKELDRVFSLFEQIIGKLVILDGNNAGTNYDCLRVYGKITSFKPGLTYGQTPIDLHIEGVL